MDDLHLWRWEMVLSRSYSHLQSDWGPGWENRVPGPYEDKDNSDSGKMFEGHIAAYFGLNSIIWELYLHSRSTWIWLHYFP